MWIFFFFKVIPFIILLITLFNSNPLFRSLPSTDCTTTKEHASALHTLLTNDGIFTRILILLGGLTIISVLLHIPDLIAEGIMRYLHHWATVEDATSQKELRKHLDRMGFGPEGTRKDSAAAYIQSYYHGGLLPPTSLLARISQFATVLHAKARAGSTKSESPKSSHAANAINAPNASDASAEANASGGPAHGPNRANAGVPRTPNRVTGQNGRRNANELLMAGGRRAHGHTTPTVGNASNAGSDAGTGAVAMGLRGGQRQDDAGEGLGGIELRLRRC